MEIDAKVLMKLRSRMMSVAYRMLGSVVEAEDVVQDAFVRLQTTDDVLLPEAFLVRVTTRLCVDRLRAARRREYVGPWVPEPVSTKSGDSSLVLAESLTQAFLLMLERLSPSERAAFLLRTVFDYEYAEIAEIVGKSETHVRQIVTRARQRLGRDELRFRPSQDQAVALAEQFVDACRAGDIKQIEAMFAGDVAVLSDGGGKATAARVVIAGRNRAAKFLAGVFRKRLRYCELQLAWVNGQPGVQFVSEGQVVNVVSFLIEQDIRAVYMVLNPDKLVRWPGAEVD